MVNICIIDVDSRRSECLTLVLLFCAGFAYPVGVSSADSNGTIYVADTNNNLIRKISSLNLGCSILVNKNIKTEGRGLAM